MDNKRKPPVVDLRRDALCEERTDDNVGRGKLGCLNHEFWRQGKFDRHSVSPGPQDKRNPLYVGNKGKQLYLSALIFGYTRIPCNVS